MSVCSDLVNHIKIPKMVRVKQKFAQPILKDVCTEIRKELSREIIKQQIKSNMSIAITCGSRGVANIAVILREIANICTERGARPFIIPAMGSHGGATALGQLEIVNGYGVTEEFCGCPIKATMKTTLIGNTSEGHNVLIDKYAAGADGIIVVNRIKAHTAFSGKYESGLMKMMTIGLGKQQGAEVCHTAGFGQMQKLVPLFGNVILNKAPILFGVATIENAYDDTAEIHAVTKHEIQQREPKLLEKAKTLMGRIWIPETDVLIVDKIGKNISGDGTDPNVTGNFGTPYVKGGLKAKRWVVLDLTDETHGNANGIGLFDATTMRLFNKMDFEKTYPNVITNTELGFAKIPIMMECDKDAIAVGIKACNNIDYNSVKVIRIKNSLDIEEILLSESLLKEAMKNEHLEILGEPEDMVFNKCGNLW